MPTDAQTQLATMGAANNTVVVGAICQIVAHAYLITSTYIGPSEGYALNPCEDGQWCCQTYSSPPLQSCCNGGKGSFSLRVGGIISTSVASSTETAAISSCTSSGGLETPVIGKCASDKSAIVGASIGSVLGAALLASVVVICFLIRHRRGRSTLPSETMAPAQESGNQIAGTTTMTNFGSTTITGHQIHEMETSHA
jgi:hypothetical protein